MTLQHSKTPKRATAKAVTPSRVAASMLMRSAHVCRRHLPDLPLRGRIDLRAPWGPALQQTVPQGGGQPLPVPTREFFESRLGEDLGHVRIHTNASAAASASDLGAEAYAVDQDISFASDRFAPETTWGRSLLAHELVHTIQARQSASAGMQQTQERIESVEREAADVARGVAAGRSTVTPLQVAPRGAVLRQPTPSPAAAAVPAPAPVSPVLARVALHRGVGRSQPNEVADVQAVQDRLLALQFLSPADHARESPAAGATGRVPEAQLPATIAAIQNLEREVVRRSRLGGQVTPGGPVLQALNRAIPRPTAAQEAGVTAARSGIAETVVRGVTITAAVGDVPAADVVAGTANLPVEVARVQSRLVQLGYLAAGHGEQPTRGATAAIPSSQLRQTIAAITRFQQRQVAFWIARHRIGGGGPTRGRVAPNDSTNQLLDRISSFREVFSTGEDIQFRDFVHSGVTVNVGGTEVVGTAPPSSLPFQQYTAVGLSNDEARPSIRFRS